ncbi:MAG: hypothetical protein PHH13_02505 [Candidatus Peribacteraceae bacterium]|nr:hypothetical protein [Candidatus Peribacteraceae bacterium]
MNAAVAGVESVVKVEVMFVTVGGGMPPDQLRAEVGEMLSLSGKLWVGNLELYRNQFGRSIQGRQISRRTIVSSYAELLAQVVSLLAEEAQDAEPFGEEGSSLINGLLIRPFFEKGETPDARSIAIDCVNVEQGLFRVYHPTVGDEQMGLNGSRAYMISDGQLCFAD